MGDERCLARPEPGCQSLPEGAAQLGEQAEWSCSGRPVPMIPSLALLTCAFSLELPHAPERRYFPSVCTSLLVQGETLTLGGEQPRQDVSNLRKIVVSEGG